MTRYRRVVQYKSPKRGKSYSVKLNLQSGRLTCNCPMWIYNIRGDRTCSHTDRAYEEFDIDQVPIGLMRNST
jgi:hypothetical protein